MYAFFCIAASTYEVTFCLAGTNNIDCNSWTVSFDLAVKMWYSCINIIYNVTIV